SIAGLVAVDTAFRSRRPSSGNVLVFRGARADAVTEPTARPSRRAWWKYLLILAGAGVLIILAGLWYITTDSFQGLVRRRLVAEVERITGGHAQIGSFHTTPFRMQVEVRNITV